MGQLRWLQRVDVIRGQHDEHNGYQEISQAQQFKYIIVNCNIEEAYGKLESIIIEHNDEKSNHCSEYQDLCRDLAEEFNTAGWIQELKQQFQAEPADSKKA